MLQVSWHTWWKKKKITQVQLNKDDELFNDVKQPTGDTKVLRGEKML